MIVLGIETSCDETAAAIVASDRRILAQRVRSQMEVHGSFGGVVPELAARAHVERLAPMIEAVLADAGLAPADCDAIAATAGPGLVGAVLVGLTSGQALALAASRPFVPVNHLEAHALSARLVSPGLGFPYLLLLISGGHCQLLGVEAVGRYRRLATTIDDAAGEAFDKVAKLLGLGFPGGPAVERAARGGDPLAVPLPRPLVGSSEPHFSFAGLKTAVLRAVESGRHATADLAASFQRAVADCLADRTQRALTVFPQGTALVAAGGVAANGEIRKRLEEVAAQHGLPLVIPPQALCTDNAAMVAWAAIERLQAGLVDDPEMAARPRWPLDPMAEPVRGAGVKA
ncbi:MAG: tRNA (adenosine(37)-N6)-threonylcarbamoyltransferase complex transferase subunit TsaD [Sphingomonadaceae bacterium]